MTLVFAVMSMWPNKNMTKMDDDDDDDESSPAEIKQWEMTPQTPRGTPFTPRTQAFHALDRKLPLRAAYS